MIRPLLLAIIAALVALPVRAAAPPAPKPYPNEALPPPRIDDPGVQPVAATPPPGPATAAAPTEPIPTPPPTATPAGAAPPPDATDTLTPRAPDTRPVRDRASRAATDADRARRVAASDVAIRKQGSDTVEEYRQAGHVWMIRIVPEHGPVQTFMDTTGSGRLTRDPNEGPIAPVYYTIYEWN
jgi:hypothetical protein